MGVDREAPDEAPDYEAPDYEALWQALPSPALLLDAGGRVRELNGAAEDFLAMSRRALTGRELARLAGEDSRLADLVARAAAGGMALGEYGVEFAWPDAPVRLVDLSAVPLDGSPSGSPSGGPSTGPADGPGAGGVLVLLHPRANAERMGRALTSRDAARSVVGMSAMLAHEIKNPLAGISGAAQLLAMNATPQDRELAELIREEAERIGELVAGFDAFGDVRVARRAPVNVHDVLDRAAKSAKAGFGSHLRFVEEYDPSLPPTAGDPDQLMQVMLNLLKNAAEATPPVGGLVMLRTAYRAGVKVRTARGTESLPLQVTISDNGSGVPDELKPHIFEPFVTSKAKGSGLGLALVSKVIADHGGVITCESTPGFTTFRMLLPVASAGDIGAEGDADGGAGGDRERAA
jgi:two-component system, NtrC family, nitrogen regulation sensor histidine kinase GlnL